jgi:hypothetical protein
MPRAPGAGTVASTRTDHAEHRFLGPRRLANIDDGKTPRDLVNVTIEAGDPPTVKVKNASSHSFPTGFPGRMATLTIRGLDAEGQMVWTSSVAFAKTFFDANNKPVMGPYGVTSKDTRLEPREERSFATRKEPKVVRLEVELKESLIGAGLAKTIGLEGSPLAAPRIVVKRQHP